MKLYEYQSKSIFKRYGVPIVEGEIAETPEDVFKIAKCFGDRVVIKAQVLVGGRGKVRGVRFASSPEEAKNLAEEIFNLKIKSIPVNKVLVTKAIDILKEYYLGITVDRSIKRIVLITSSSGGVDIEELAENSPEEIHTLTFPVNKELNDTALRNFLSPVFIKQNLSKQALQTVKALYRIFIENDCSLVEINPYALTSREKLFALDSKIVFDDNGLSKHPDLEVFRNPEEYSQDELEAKNYGLSFVSMSGNIGCIVNGAGLAMATMDIIKLFDGAPANFLDVGGSSNPDKVFHAIEIITRNPSIKAILINIFGGITRCDDIARGIIKAKESIRFDHPIVIRLIGTNEQEGRRILREAGLSAFEALTEAVKKVVEIT